MVLTGACMKLNSPTTALKLSSDDVLEALGLERRRSRGQDLAVAVGLAAGGLLVGATAVLLRAGFVSLSTPRSTPRQPKAVS